jgi:enoyl-CoA hydratase
MVVPCACRDWSAPGAHGHHFDWTQSAGGEALRIGLANASPRGSTRAAAEDLAREIARFPQAAVRADRRSAYESFGLGTREALAQEWAGGIDAFMLEGAAGAARFAQGRGRQGDFQDI